MHGMKNIKYIDLISPLGVYLRKQDLRVYIGQIDNAVLESEVVCFVYSEFNDAFIDSLSYRMARWYVHNELDWI